MKLWTPLTNTEKVRLSHDEITGIISAITSTVTTSTGSNASWQVWVFGSRAHLEKKGGDIDLFLDISSPLQGTQSVSQLKRETLIKIKQNIGDRKIDLVIRIPGSPPTSLYELILLEGVLIWTTQKPTT